MNNLFRDKLKITKQNIKCDQEALLQHLPEEVIKTKVFLSSLGGFFFVSLILPL